MSIPQARLAGLIPEHSGAVAGEAQMADKAGCNAHAGGDHAPGPDTQPRTAPPDVFAISSSACFCPEDDDPDNFDGRMVTWTFAAPKNARTGAGIYRLQFVRILTPEERGNTTAQLKALAAQGIEARQGGDGTAPREARKPGPEGMRP